MHKTDLESWDAGAGTPRTRVKGILFDFDGTLARTMEDLFLAWHAAFEKHGLDILPEEYYPLEGTRVIQIARILCRKHGLEESLAEGIVHAKEEHYIHHHTLAFYDGVIDAIGRLHREGVAMGIVTASSQKKTRSTIPAEFLSCFQAIITGDDTRRGKPFPDPFLAGAKALHLDPSACIVVENAPIGVAAAKAGGFFCIGITSTVEASVLKEANIVVPSFLDAAVLIERYLSH